MKKYERKIQKDGRFKFRGKWYQHDNLIDYEYDNVYICDHGHNLITVHHIWWCKFDKSWNIGPMICGFFIGGVHVVDNEINSGRYWYNEEGLIHRTDDGDKVWMEHGRYVREENQTEHSFDFYEDKHAINRLTDYVCF